MKCDSVLKGVIGTDIHNFLYFQVEGRLMLMFINCSFMAWQSVVPKEILQRWWRLGGDEEKIEFQTRKVSKAAKRQLVRSLPSATERRILSNPLKIYDD